MVRRVISAFGRAAIKNQNGPTPIVATRKSALRRSAERFTIHSFWRLATFYAPAHRAEVKLCRISGRRLGAEVSFEIGEARRCQPGECSDAICSEEVPVTRLPRCAQSLITRESELQQWHQRGRKNKESNDLAVTRDQRMTLQEQLADGKRTSHDFAKKYGTPTAIENGIYSVVRRAIRAKA